MLSENNVEILTPVKRKKGQKRLSFWDAVYSSAISSVKQEIESFNNWIIEKTNIQRPTKVRSSAGLFAFLFARIACALFAFLLLIRVFSVITVAFTLGIYAKKSLTFRHQA